MSKPKPTDSLHRPSGFTLIELMMVVAIVGVLSTVAIPAYTQLTVRSKTSERSLMVGMIKQGVVGLYLRDGSVSLAGAVNPPTIPGTAKVVFNNRLDASWAKLSEFVQLEGAVYYQYDFTATEPGGNAPGTLQIHWAGDLDGDGVLSEKTINYERREGQYWTDDNDVSNTWCVTSPVAGCIEDGGTF
jgi:prepilin-type N-terminal cleavage/methylation domain-containing protein